MTRMMRQVRSRRRWLAAAIGLAGALAVVLSLMVTDAISALQASTQGVTPAVVNLGGQPNDCPAVQSTGTYEFRIVTPKTGPYTDPATGARFNLTMSGDTTLAFTMTGGAVEDVVVKGGTNSSHYDYMAGGPKRAVTSDGNLHAPPKGSNFYSVSQTTFCYDTLAKIGGDVWRDSNESKTKDSFESYQPGWGIALYQGSSTTPYRSTTTDANGHYEFTVPIGSQYTVCETKPGTDSASYSQSTPTNPVCASLGSGEPNGYQFQLTADTLDKSFGNLNTVSLACGSSTAGPVSTPDGSYTVKFGGSGFCSKAGARDYIFEAYTNPDQVKNFHPDGTGTGQVFLVERLRWTIAAPTGVVGVAQGSVLKYDDVLTDGISPKPMLYCLKDPRGGPDPEFDIADATGVLPTGETSCLIQSTESPTTGSTPSVLRVDYVFSSVDGYRTVG